MVYCICYYGAELYMRFVCKHFLEIVGETNNLGMDNDIHRSTTLKIRFIAIREVERSTQGQIVLVMVEKHFVRYKEIPGGYFLNSKNQKWKTYLITTMTT